jgi:hypothetical protein
MEMGRYGCRGARLAESEKQARHEWELGHIRSWMDVFGNVNKWVTPDLHLLCFSMGTRIGYKTMLHNNKA